jgi:hypothetical protein
MSKPTKNWEFYFELKDGSRTYFEQECKEPTRTKLWKALHDRLNEEEVRAIAVGVKPKNNNQ